jgi:hypothetical protein
MKAVLYTAFSGPVHVELLALGPEVAGMPGGQALCRVTSGAYGYRAGEELYWPRSEVYLTHKWVGLTRSLYEGRPDFGKLGQEGPGRTP